MNGGARGRWTRSMLAAAVALAVASGPLSGRASEGPESAGLRAPGPGVFSPLPAAWEAHRFAPLLPPGPLRIAASSGPAAGPSLVLGWLPYWTVSTATLHLDRLTHLAYFGVQVGAGGVLANPRHWTTGELVPLIAAARDAGVSVVLTLICFDADVMDAVLGDPVARAALVGRVTDMVVAGGGDGVNVDFEGLSLARKADFVTFVAGLKTALDVALGRSHVSVATPAVDWKGAYDYDELARVADALVIMGYEYHYSGGSPGPIAPLAPSDRWGKYSLAWTLDDYDHFAGVENRGHIALGLPLYGHDWPVVDDAVPGVATGKAASPGFAQCAEGGVRWGWRFDAPSTTPWYFIPDESRQVWCEDRASLAAKIGLAADRGLAGVAFWALGYEADLEAPWQALVEAWPEPPLADDPGPPETAEAAEFSEPVGVADAAEPLERAEVAEASEPSGELPTARDVPPPRESGPGADAVEDDAPSRGGGCAAGGAASGSAWAFGAPLLLAAWATARGRGAARRRTDAGRTAR